MAEDVGALFEWGRSLVMTAAAAGFPVQGVPDSTRLEDFLAWARALTADAAGFVSLPTLGEEAGYSAALSWARTLDGAARGMGADLPPLP